MGCDQRNGGPGAPSASSSVTGAGSAAPEGSVPAAKPTALTNGFSYEEPQDSALAINEPDKYAWRLFVALNWPADPAKCEADKAKKLGDNGKTTWESWRSKRDTFLPKAKAPDAWTACSAVTPKVLARNSEHEAVAEQLVAMKVPKTGPGIFIEPPTGVFSTAEDEEVRLNRATYEFILQNKLYDLDEQERLAKAGTTTLKFPLAAKEVKGHWIVIEEADKPRYHWAEVTEDGGAKKLYGLVALHIITKDLPRWFWSTFEHVDNASRWAKKHPPPNGDDGFAGWEAVRPRDSFACDAAHLDCGKAPTGIGLDGTKWENYRLRGTQVDFVDDRGRPTVLPNSKIEGGFEQTSMSCITCHALAVKGDRARTMPIRIIQMKDGKPIVNPTQHPLGLIGVPDTSLFDEAQNGSPGKDTTLMGLDFVWSLRNAQRSK